MRQQRLEVSFEAGKVIHPNRHGNRQHAEITESENPYDSRELKRLGRIDGADPCMGAGAAQDGAMEHVGKLDIIDVSRPPGNKPKIFAPLERSADITVPRPILGFHVISRAL